MPKRRADIAIASLRPWKRRVKDAASRDAIFGENSTTSAVGKHRDAPILLDSDSEPEIKLEPDIWKDLYVYKYREWDKQDTELLEEMLHAEIGLWRHCINVLDSIPPDFIPAGKSVDISTNNGKKRGREIAALRFERFNWSDTIAKVLGKLLFCPIFEDKSIIHHAIDLAMFYRLQKKPKPSSSFLYQVVDGRRVYRKAEYAFFNHIKNMMIEENRIPDVSSCVVLRDLNVITMAWNKYAEGNDLHTTEEETEFHQHFLGKQIKAHDVNDIKRAKKEWTIGLRKVEAESHTYKPRSSSVSSFAVPSDINHSSKFSKESFGEELRIHKNREQEQRSTYTDDESENADGSHNSMENEDEDGFESETMLQALGNNDDGSLGETGEIMKFANGDKLVEEDGLSILDDLNDHHDEGEPHTQHISDRLLTQLDVNGAEPVCEILFK